MELDQLRYFTAVAELLSFTRAAERCLVAQPSLSQQIIKLEHELGAPLFERLGRTVRLTPAGRTFYEHAVRVLSAAGAARDSLRSADDWKQGPASIGAILTVAPYLLPPVLRTFTRKFPQARLTVREDFTAGIVQAVLAGELDLGIAALPIDEPRLQATPLFTEELLVALPAKHPLAVRRKKLTAADLAEQSFVLLDETHCLGEQVVSFCRDRKFQPTITCRTSQLLSTLSFSTKFILHLYLCCNTSVICCWQPYCIFSLHTMVSNNCVLNTENQSMSYMQNPCHIWRRQGHHIS